MKDVGDEIMYKEIVRLFNGGRSNVQNKYFSRHHFFVTDELKQKKTMWGGSFKDFTLYNLHDTLLEIPGSLLH